MSLNAWLLYVATVFFVSATPGPNMLLAMTHGIRYGVRHTLPTLAGLLLALGIIMCGSALGLGALLATSELLFSVVKYAGAAYLVWLGIKTWRAPASPLQESTAAAVIDTAWQRFRTGFLVAMSNPKAFVFFHCPLPSVYECPSRSIGATGHLSGNIFCHRKHMANRLCHRRCQVKKLAQYSLAPTMAQSFCGWFFCCGWSGAHQCEQTVIGSLFFL